MERRKSLGEGMRAGRKSLGEGVRVGRNVLMRPIGNRISRKEGATKGRSDLIEGVIKYRSCPEEGVVEGKVRIN